MDIIARESFQGKGSYPFYTLARADHMTCTGGCPSVTQPVVICQYAEDDIVVFTYDTFAAARDTFCVLCDVPGIHDKLRYA